MDTFAPATLRAPVVPIRAGTPTMFLPVCGAVKKLCLKATRTVACNVLP